MLISTSKNISSANIIYLCGSSGRDRGPRPPPTRGKSLSLGFHRNKHLDPTPWKKLDPPPMENVEPPLETWKIIVFLEKNLLDPLCKISWRLKKCHTFFILVGPGTLSLDSSNQVNPTGGHSKSWSGFNQIGRLRVVTQAVYARIQKVLREGVQLWKLFFLVDKGRGPDPNTT